MFATLLLCCVSRLLGECWVNWWRDNKQINTNQRLWVYTESALEYLLWMPRCLSIAHADVSSQTQRHAAPAEDSEIPEEFFWFPLFCICQNTTHQKWLQSVTCRVSYTVSKRVSHFCRTQGFYLYNKVYKISYIKSRFLKTVGLWNTISVCVCGGLKWKNSMC